MTDTAINIHSEKDVLTTTLSQLGQYGRAFDMGLDISRDPSRPTEPFSQVAMVFVCVQKIIDAAGQIPLMLSDANDQIIESGPAYDFLFNNPDQPLRRFLTMTLGTVALYRECYWVRVADDGPAARALQVYGPNRVKPVIRRGVVTGYKLHLPGETPIPLFIEDVIPLLGFNPDVPYHGVGPLLSGRLDISSNYQATLFNEASLANGAYLGTLITFPPGPKLSEEEIAMLRSQFDARHAGARNAGRTALLTGGADVKVMTQTMAELQMVDLRKFDAFMICTLFGVPPELVGLNSEAQYAHGPAGQRFVTDTVGPILTFVADHLNDHVLPRYAVKVGHKSVAAKDCRTLSRVPLMRRQWYRTQHVKAQQAGRKLWAWFAVEDHPAIQQMLRDRAEKMLLYVDKGVPLNQVIDAGDLPFEHVPWGDHFFVSAGMMPAQWILDGGMDAVLGGSLPEGDGGVDEPEKNYHHEGHEAHEEKTKQIDRAKANRIWQKYIASWQPIEKEFISALRTYFRRQKADLIAKLEAIMSDRQSSIVHRQSKAEGDILARVVIDLRKENDKLKAIHRTFFVRAATLGAAQIATDLGAAAKETAEQVVRRQAFQRTLVVSAQKIQSVNATTAARVAKTLQDGLTSGDGLTALRKRLETEASFSSPRAQRIARSHTGSAVSAGRHEAAVHLGADLKFWVTSKDEAVRATHRQAEITHKDGIPLTEAFVVGGDFLLYPGDPSASPANVINCRCMELIKAAGGKSFSLDDYDRRPMLDYTTFKQSLNEAHNV